MEEVKVASDFLVGDPALLEKKIDAIRSGGPQKLQVSARIWFIISLSVLLSIPYVFLVCLLNLLTVVVW